MASHNDPFVRHACRSSENVAQLGVIDEAGNQLARRSIARRERSGPGVPEFCLPADAFSAISGGAFFRAHSSSFSSFAASSSAAISTNRTLPPL